MLNSDLQLDEEDLNEFQEDHIKRNILEATTDNFIDSQPETV